MVEDERKAKRVSLVILSQSLPAMRGRLLSTSTRKHPHRHIAVSIQADRERARETRAQRDTPTQRCGYKTRVCREASTEAAWNDNRR